MENVTFALYAKAIRGDDIGNYVFCWNFQKKDTAIAFAKQRSDVGDIILFKHTYNNNELIKKEYIDTFKHF
jgi:hypothetical protein